MKEIEAIHPKDRELMFSVALAEQISNFFPAFEGEIGVENKMGLLKWVMDKYRKVVHQTRLEAIEEYKRDNLLLNEIRNEQFHLGFNHGLEEAAKVVDKFHEEHTDHSEKDEWYGCVICMKNGDAKKIASQIRTLAKKED